ncbi:MAG: BON domain-containing protein [Acidobacteriota bacterium]
MRTRMRVGSRAILNAAVSILVMAGCVKAAANAVHKALPDGTIRTLVLHKLDHKKMLHDNNIQVVVEDGSVTLTGSVPSLGEEKQAEKLALSVEDVTRVINRLTIEPARSDQQMADDFAKDVRSFVFYDIFDWITGDVDHGVLSLQGYVREPWRKADYQRLAEDVAGVREVHNEIQVLPLSSYDDQLRIATARLIYTDPLFVRYAHRALPPIHIIVENGRILLKGAVANRLERQEIESIVRSGVVAFDVVDDLKVDNET